jgi:hypothetical protein
MPPAERQDSRALWGEIGVLIRRAQNIDRSFKTKMFHSLLLVVSWCHKSFFD